MVPALLADSCRTSSKNTKPYGYHMAAANTWRTCPVPKATRRYHGRRYPLLGKRRSPSCSRPLLSPGTAPPALILTTDNGRTLALRGQSAFGVACALVQGSYSSVRIALCAWNPIALLGNKRILTLSLSNFTCAFKERSVKARSKLRWPVLGPKLVSSSVYAWTVSWILMCIFDLACCASLYLHGKTIKHSEVCSLWSVCTASIRSTCSLIPRPPLLSVIVKSLQINNSP